MTHAQLTLSARIRRFASIFVPAFVFILIARLAQGSSLNQVLCNSVMWASISAAFWITLCTNASHRIRKAGPNQPTGGRPSDPTPPSDPSASDHSV